MTRRDGWAARDLDVGAIIALAPSVQPFVDLLGLVDSSIDAPTVRKVLRSWGPGKFDAELLLDGKAFRPDGRSAATLIPPAFGLAGVNLHTWTGWGSVTHWNGFVANLEMQGRGTFYDPRLNDATKFPIAALAGSGDVRNDPDLVTSKLAPLHVYQLSLQAPRPPRGSFDAAAAARGDALFDGKAGCARCHVPPLYTSPAGTCTSRTRSASMTSRPSARPTATTGRLHSKDSGHMRKAVTTTTAVLRGSPMSSPTTTGLSRWALSAAERRDLIEYLKSL